MSGRDRVVTVILALGVVAAIGVRLHVLDDDFPNPDIAGIVYNAELVLDGGLPYVDTAEIKPPGAFGLAAISIAAFGRSLEALQLFFAAWLGVGAWGVWLAARAIHADAHPQDPRTVRRGAAIAAMVALVATAMFSYNYSAWMVPAYALAVGAALHGMRRRGRVWPLVAGAAAILAVLTIQRAAVLVVLLPALWLWARRRGWQGATGATLVSWAAGAVVLVGVVSLPWLTAGHGESLARALVPWSVASDYAAASAGSPAGSIAEAASQLVQVFWFPVGLVIVAGLAAAWDRGESTSPWLPGLLWLVLSIVAAGLGGLRFYLHYLVQYAPALGLLAGHPALARRIEPALARRLGRRRRDSLVITLGGVLVVAQLVEIGLGRGHRHEAMARRLTSGKTAAQAAGEHIRKHTAHGDTVLAWGWTAWPIYYFTGLRSPSRVYKPLGVVTTFNTNTEFDDGAGPRFRPGPAADDLIAEFDRAPPAYFVYSPSMVVAFGARPDPLQDFTALRERLEAGYTIEATFGDLRLFRRREP